MADFLPGAVLSARLSETTLTERSTVAERGLLLLLALDVFDPTNRARLAALPQGYDGEDLSNPDLRRAFVAEAKYIALNYRPAYLALGIEVNVAFERNPGRLSGVRRGVPRGLRRGEGREPEHARLPTFQYEQLLGLIPWEPPHVPRWELLDDFTGRLDLFAITTYPSFAYSVARKVPPLYYSQIRDHASASNRLRLRRLLLGARPRGAHSSTPAEQRRFLQRLLRDADELGASLLVWFAAATRHSRRSRRWTCCRASVCAPPMTSRKRRGRRGNRRSTALTIRRPRSIRRWIAMRYAAASSSVAYGARLDVGDIGAGVAAR